MKLAPLNRAKFEADPSKRMLMNFINALADLAQPKKALSILEDSVRLRAYDDAVQRAVSRVEGENDLHHVCQLIPST